MSLKTLRLHSNAPSKQELYRHAQFAFKEVKQYVYLGSSINKKCEEDKDRSQDVEESTSTSALNRLIRSKHVSLKAKFPIHVCIKV